MCLFLVRNGKKERREYNVWKRIVWNSKFYKKKISFSILMDGDGKPISETPERLEEIAVGVCKDFLRRNGIGRIELYGGNPKVLLYMRERMQKYFFDQIKPVLVTISFAGYNECTRELSQNDLSPEERPFPVNLDILISYHNLSREYPLKFPLSFL